MSKLDEIEARVSARMAEIDRRILGQIGSETSVEPSACSRSVSSADGISRLSHGSPSSAAGFAIAPFNPEYLEMVQENRRGLNNDGRDYEFGLFPCPYDFSTFNRVSAALGSRRAARDFPAKFDLRDEGVLQPVRNQSPYGTCWAHAAMASVESCLQRKTGEVLDLSENNLANLHGFDSFYDRGGFAFFASAYFLRWDGPVLERDDPYGKAGGSRSFPAAKHVQEVRWIPPMRDGSDTLEIKAAVRDFGAVWVAYRHDHVAQALHPKTAAFYYDGEQSPKRGHAVAIVGWDDNYPVSNFNIAPPANGAWIVRNSWGEGWGDAGYFYVSYYDSTFGKLIPQMVFNGVESNGNYDDVLQYDYLGITTGVGCGERSVAANVFSVVRETTVKAVGIYVLVPGARYRISIHLDCAPSDPGSGAEQGVTVGVCDWAGFATVKLESPVCVPCGSRFSVVVEMTTPGCNTPIAVECRVPNMSRVDSACGQSYILTEKGWMDLTVEPAGENNYFEQRMNFCCKAYVGYGDTGVERSHKKFCKKCGKYTWVETWSEAARCQYCGAWL